MFIRRKLSHLIFYLLVTYFLVTCVFFVGVIKSPVTVRLSAQRLLLEACGPSCMHMQPSMKNDEFKPAGFSQTVKRVCPGSYWVNRDYLAWEVNFNVPRTFRFGPDEIVNDKHGAAGSNDLVSNKDNTKNDTKKEITIGVADNVKSGTVLEMNKTMSALIEPLNMFQSLYTNLESSQQGIPKILHFIWTDEIIPTIFVDNLKLFRETHPAWQIHFWTLAAGERFIKKKEREVIKVYRRLSNVFKADVLRYVLLYHIGGGYFDLDSKVIKPLDPLAENNECLLGPEPIENAVTVLKRRSLLANSGLLCKPGHAFFRHVIDQIYIQNTNEPGPRFLTLCFNGFLSKLLDSKKKKYEGLTFEIRIAPHEYFELFVNNGNAVDKSMENLCRQYSKNSKRFFNSCVNQPKQNGCTAMFKSIPANKRMELEACIEWESHGKGRREKSTEMYIQHEHYGTHQHNRIKTLEFSKDNNISKILPGISIHA